jgi:hypothetical protein
LLQRAKTNFTNKQYSRKNWISFRDKRNFKDEYQLKNKNLVIVTWKWIDKEWILIKGTILTLLIMSIIFTVGCAEKQVEPGGISEDATIIHKTYGAFTVPEMQLQVLTVNKTAVVFTTSDAGGNFPKTYEKPFNETAFRNLTGLFEEYKFLEMNNSYVPQEGQPIVADVGTLEISLTDQNKTKTVTVDPYYSEYMPEGLQKIDSALVELRTCALSTSPEEAEMIAENWIKNSPTYSFDGFDLKMEKNETLDTIPEQHVLTYTFTSRHGGYGNRTNQMVTEALTPHRIEVTVSEMNVISAIIDGKWNELAQEPVVNETGNFSNVPGTTGTGENLTELKYRLTEDKAPWDKWYEEGHIQFIKAPTPSELIVAYYGTVHSIQIFDVKKVEGCDLNYSYGGFYYTAKVKESDSAKMRDLGWVTSNE